MESIFEILIPEILYTILFCEQMTLLTETIRRYFKLINIYWNFSVRVRPKFEKHDINPLASLDGLNHQKGCKHKPWNTVCHEWRLQYSTNFCYLTPNTITNSKRVKQKLKLHYCFVTVTISVMHGRY